MINKFTESNKFQDARNKIKQLWGKFRNFWKASVLWNKIVGFMRKPGNVSPVVNRVMRLHQVIVYLTDDVCFFVDNN